MALCALQVTETDANDLGNKIKAARRGCGLVLHEAIQQEQALVDTAKEPAEGSRSPWAERQQHCKTICRC